ncbi:hypothetical protein MAR_001587 [Mya arenaria]|uniref:Uncharacterized protein n=1 Tax=Mya arenaria TaxID=6604 RepID=A0ABY7FF23_MYAAR|nr:hypothetical protein MAR_001587 [Mya arenaria]
MQYLILAFVMFGLALARPGGDGGNRTQGERPEGGDGERMGKELVEGMAKLCVRMFGEGEGKRDFAAAKVEFGDVCLMLLMQLAENKEAMAGEMSADKSGSDMAQGDRPQGGRPQGERPEGVTPALRRMGKMNDDARRQFDPVALFEAMADVCEMLGPVEAPEE